MTDRQLLRNAFSRIFIQRDLQTSRYSKVDIADFMDARAAKPRNGR